MRIGYSMWGFLGDGVVDTSDGSRAYRRPFIDGLLAAGHAVVFLQPDRDLLEAGQAPRSRYRWDLGSPDLDAVIFKWRESLPGSNTVDCGTAEHTGDPHRQTDLFHHYTQAGTPTLIWDLNRQLPSDDPSRLMPNVVVGEFALLPTPGAVSLLCPVPDALLDAADPKQLASLERPAPLVYVGNQHGREEAFDRYFAPAAATVTHRVAGRWTRTQNWPQVNFTGQCGFAEVERIHRNALTTVLLVPDRYARAGHMTSRWFEALLAGCLPLTPTEVRFADAYAPRDLQIDSSQDVIDKVAWLQAIAGSPEHADLIAACLPLLEPFRCSAQVSTAITILEGLS